MSIALQYYVNHAQFYFSVSKNGFVRNINYFMESSISYSANTSSQSNDENNNNNSKESNHNNNNNDSTTVNYNEKIASANLQSPVRIATFLLFTQFFPLFPKFRRFFVLFIISVLQTTPYWNNPIWSNNISSSPQNVSAKSFVSKKKLFIHDNATMVYFHTIQPNPTKCGLSGVLICLLFILPLLLRLNLIYRICKWWTQH